MRSGERDIESGKNIRIPGILLQHVFYRLCKIGEGDHSLKIIRTLLKFQIVIGDCVCYI